MARAYLKGIVSDTDRGAHNPTYTLVGIEGDRTVTRLYSDTPISEVISDLESQGLDCTQLYRSCLRAA